MAHPNEELIRGGYEAFAHGDLDGVANILSDNIRWHVPGSSLIAGDYRGHEEVFELLRRLQELTTGTFALQVHDALANDEHVVVLVGEHAERNGKELNVQDAHIWHVDKSKATEFWGASTDQVQADEFWS